MKTGLPCRAPSRDLNVWLAAVALLVFGADGSAAQTGTAAPVAGRSAPLTMPSAADLAPAKPSLAPVPPVAQAVPVAPVPPVDAWTPAEIAAGIAQCQALLATAVVVASPVPPFKSGDCGSPAAVELVSIGRSPEIKLEPAVVVTCELAATLATWASAELQPLARKHLGAAITRIDTMSSYACRNAYGRKKSRLSEHGRANAIDIRAFVTARNDETSVLADWGPSERKMAAMIAAAKAEEARRLAAVAAAKSAAPQAQPGAVGPAEPSAPPSAAVAAPSAAPAGSRMALTSGSTPSAAPDREEISPLPRLRTIIEGLPGVGRNVPQLPRPSENIGFGQPSYLGGAKPAQSATAPVAPSAPSRPAQPGSSGPSQKQLFLKAVHASACRTFGTVLGPEANAAHENHFHFDMAERRNGNFCE